MVAAALLAVGATGSAAGDFPYLPKSGADPHNPLTWKLPPGETPSNLNGDWRFLATPETSPQSDALVNPKPAELCGIEGAGIVDPNAVAPASTSCVLPGTPVKTAFEQTLGRPDVVIAVLDSGIEWNNPGAMTALRDKVHLNQGELPAPRHDLSGSLVAGESCGSYRSASGGDYNRRGDYDVNGDGVFDVRDYACDSRVAGVVNGGNPRHGRRHGPPGVLTPEDLILAFSDGTDHDHNGYANDIAGWNFVDDNNDPFDDVQYGHGTGEAQDSNGEANTNQELGTCPDCTVLPLRVGESFIADDNRFAQAALYATDSNAYVIQEALGTLNNSYFARQAVEYAYRHGTAVIGSAADEAAEHHNQPGALPDIIVVNSVTKYTAFTAVPPSYLQFNGCTNFGTRIDVAVPSTSCSSEATGKGAGVAGLIYSAALNAIAAGRLHAAAGCTRVDGSACPLTANEVRQLMASGNIAGTTTPGQGSSTGASPADAGTGGQADDVNFAAQPELSCTPIAAPGCTDPNLNTVFSPAVQGGVDAPAPATRRYHARRGYDEFYGYGRLSAYKAVSAAANGAIPPEAEITSPDWFQQVDPASTSVSVGGYVNARGGAGYTCRLDVAPGVQPNNGLVGDTPPGDFAPAPSSWCDGHTVHHAGYTGTVGQISTAALRARFPATDGAFNGNETAGTPQTSNGRPNTAPYGFTVRLVVSTPASGSTPAMTGEDRRQLWLHRDQQMLSGFPRELQTDGASSPLLIDLAGNDYNQLVLATSDGQVHAFRRNGGELPGWPVHTEPAAPAHERTGVPQRRHRARLRRSGRAGRR